MTLSNRGQGFLGQYNTSSSSNSQASTKKSSRARVIDRSNEELDNAKKQLNEALHEVMKQRKRAEYFKGQTKLTKWRKVSESSLNNLVKAYIAENNIDFNDSRITKEELTQMVRELAES